jgi:DNA repair protein RadC
MKEIPHYIGHRKRLRQKLLSGGPKSFADYEILELLLFGLIPRRDVKPLAKDLLKKFKNLFNIVNSEKEQLLSIDGTTENTYINFLLIRELMSRMLNEKIVDTNIISSWATLLDYLKISMGGLKIEQFRILFLSKKNCLIIDEVIASGTIDQAPVYPREIIKRALFHEAGAIILVHNHPSGSAKPSRADIELTNKIIDTCLSVNITVHDHVIIAGNEYFSFKSNLLL